MKKKLSKFQVYTRVRNRELSAIQIEKIKKIVITLAHYIFLDRETLNYFADEKIGLSFLRIARDYSIVIETQNQKQMQKKDQYFFELGENGLYLLNLDQIEFEKLSIFIDRKAKEKILNFNRFLMHRKEKLKYEVIDENYNIFKTEQKIFYYDLVDPAEVIKSFKKEIIKNIKDNENIEDYFYQNYNLIKIPKSKIKIHGQTKKTY
jgi:hypothetical protein